MDAEAEQAEKEQQQVIHELEVGHDLPHGLRESAPIAHVADDEDESIGHVDRADEPESGDEAKRVDEAHDERADKRLYAGLVRIGDDEGERDEKSRPDESAQLGVERADAAPIERIEEGDEQVDEHGKVERHVAPDAHVRAEPVEPRLLAQLALPPHLAPHAVERLEEARYLAVLLVLLGGQEDALLGLFGQVLAYGRHRKHDLLHCAILSYDLLFQTIYSLAHLFTYISS